MIPTAQCQICKKRYIGWALKYQPCKCCGKVLKVKTRPTKYVLRYERSLKEIAEIFGVTRATIYNWVKNDKKRAWMEEILKNL